MDDDISVGGSGSDGGLGDGYLKFVNIGRFMKLPKDALSMRIGQFELDLPFSPARSWNLSGWDIYEQSNIGNMNGVYPLQNVNNAFALSNAAQGFEFSGGHTYRGYHYSLAIVNQNTGGTPGDGTNVPPEVAYTSDSNFKDIYARFSYRFNLERDPASRDAIQAAGATGPRDHTFLNFGTLYFYGRSVQRFTGQAGSGTQTVLTAREPFYRVGGDVSFNYRTFNVFGQYLYGHDQNLLPLVPAGFVLPGRIHYRPCREVWGWFRGGRLFGIAVADDHHAMGFGELYCGPSQWHRSRRQRSSGAVSVTLALNAKSLYAGCSVPDSRQYQSIV